MTIKYSLASLICLFFLSLPVFTQKLVHDVSFAPTINGSVNFVEILGNGKILIAGDFTSVNGVARIKMARLNPDGSLDASFDANSTTIINSSQNAVIFSMEVLPDGKILLAGYFGSGQPLEYIRSVARLNADGTFDSTLTSIPQIKSGSNLHVKKAEQLPNGKILICGNFTMPNGNQQPKLARYNFNGTYDSTFTTAMTNDCQDVEAQPDGKYLVAGYYSTVNPNAGLTRFNPDDSVDTTFNAATLPGSSITPYRGIELQSDGKIIAFQQAGSDARVSRLNADGSLQVTFPTALFQPNDTAIQPNGKVIVVGEYRSIFGQSANFNRFYTDGTHDPSLNRLSFYGASSSDEPKAVAVAADGKVIVGGNFTKFTLSIGGVQINQSYLARFAPEAIPIKPKFDFDGDGKDDIAVYRPSDRVWYLNQSTAGFFSAQFGLPQDKPVVADYDDDGKADIAVFRDGVWYWLRSSDFTLGYTAHGQAGDIPQQRNANGSASKLVFRPSDALWYEFRPFLPPSSFSIGVELPGDIPVREDYDGDGFSDLAVFRDGNWFYKKSSNHDIIHYQFGLAGDKPVPADYDGDGRTDYAVFRPSDGVWYIKKSTEGFYAVRWGLADDLPVPADYDGDGKTDIAVYRNGVWYQMRSTNTYHIEQFGLSNDIPAQLR
jgi:uncharacterized delta-60 repeat protein